MAKCSTARSKYQSHIHRLHWRGDVTLGSLCIKCTRVEFSIYTVTVSGPQRYAKIRKLEEWIAPTDQLHWRAHEHEH